MTEAWQKKYQWRRTWGDERGMDGRPHEDYQGFDGDQSIGRIFFESAGPTKDLWRWAGGRPKALKGSSLMPNAGYCSTAAEAARTVEDYWDAMKSRIAER